MVFLVKNCKPQGAIKLRNPLIQPTIHLSIQPCERRVKLMLFSRLQGRQSCSRSSMHDATSRCSKIDLMPPSEVFWTCAKMISREAGNKRGIPWQRVESSAPLKKLSQEHGQHNDHFSSAREYIYGKIQGTEEPGNFPKRAHTDTMATAKQPQRNPVLFWTRLRRNHARGTPQTKSISLPQPESATARVQ